MRAIANKVAVITGASRGIGEGIARLFAAEGARLMLCGRNKKRLDEVARSLGLARRNIATVAADITKPSGMRTIINAACRKFGSIDIFVNNAGVGIHKKAVDLTEKEFDAVMNTNFKAIFYCFKELLPRLLIQGHGQIINISSMAGKQGVPGLSVYSASKAAVNVFSEAVAGEVRNDNIKISVLAPASTDTGFMSNLSRKSKTPSRAAKKLTVAEVAEAVLFLAKQNENAWMSLAEIRPLLVKR
jgi:3-oxoacyl-[acyl-carrier protein] reductase